jgi:hypothetical protein
MYESGSPLSFRPTAKPVSRIQLSHPFHCGSGLQPPSSLQFPQQLLLPSASEEHDVPGGPHEGPESGIGEFLIS